MILSYHPFFHGHRFRLCAGREPDERDRELMRRASAVLLPPGRLPSLYAQANRYCGLVFPEYGPRYAYPGKIGDIRLFRELGLSHPSTHCFDRLQECPDRYWQDIEYPVIIKHQTGGEGRLVYVVHGPQEAKDVLSSFQGMEKSGLSGFLVQELVPAEQRTLRIAVIHTQMYSYWRVQPDENKVVHNFAQGGTIDHISDPGLKTKGQEVVRELCRCTGINLAGVDILFDRRKEQAPRPLLLEINYFFAVHGLGGFEAYHHKLKQAVRDWLLEHELSLPPKDFGSS